MADEYGYPVVDIYVDSVPPQAPRPEVLRVSTDSVAFTWNPVVDVGDGAGADYFVAGMDHYTSWVTLNGSSQPLQLLSTAEPRIVTQTGMSPVDVACVHVQAFDKVQNASPERSACSRALATPPMPRWAELAVRVAANPARTALVGLDSWFWLDPAPSAITIHEFSGGTDYAITATPVSAAWDFGDGGVADLTGASGYGRPYPQRSTITHLYEAHSQDGYRVRASVRYAVTWTAGIAGRGTETHPMGVFVLTAVPLRYPVEQAQPELLRI
jgi:hypothetical protein